MDFAKVNVEIRRETGKGSARRSRASGRVPAVLYGKGQEPMALSLDPLALVRSMDKQRKRNTVFSLEIPAENKAGDITAMIRDLQVDPLSRQIVHVDFQRVSLDDEVRVSVPLVLKGVPVGVVNGGQLHQNVHLLPVAAKPGAIPISIELDVSGLNIGQALHVSDLKLVAGVRALIDAKGGLASVVAPRAEKIEEAAPVAAAEGAAAAPAAGAEGAAAAPAAGGKKEPAKKEAGKDDKKK